MAADALDVKKDSAKDNAVYPQERVTDMSFGYTNLFSPPIETEGYSLIYFMQMYISSYIY